MYCPGVWVTHPRPGRITVVDDGRALNGTYVNRQRVDSHRLEEGDELQIGKYKLSYLERG